MLFIIMYWRRREGGNLLNFIDRPVFQIGNNAYTSLSGNSLSAALHSDQTVYTISDAQNKKKKRKKCKEKNKKEKKEYTLWS